MPGPGQRHKGKGKAKAKGGGGSSSQGNSQSQTAVALKVVPCMTLDEDEVTRCDDPATEGYPRPERCKTHHTQYVNMYKKYKDASKVVDEAAKGGKIPTNDQITQYRDVSAILDKARYVKSYIEAIRVERTGRDIHSRRFFLKVDNGHKLRLKILTKEMIRGVEVLDCLQSRAYELHLEKTPRPDWADATIPPSVNDKSSKDRFLSAEEVVNNLLQFAIDGTTGVNPKAITANTSRTSRTSGVEDEQADLIDLEKRRQKIGILQSFQFITDPDVAAAEMAQVFGKDLDESELRRSSIVSVKAMQQYALRIFFYDPNLFAKVEGKVSLKDLVLSDDFLLEDMMRFFMLFQQWLGFGLLWMKDSVVEALSISSAGLSANAANVGDPKNRIKILDGWIYNVTHFKKTSSEAWFRLIHMVQPIPANVENRFVRLCNSYDDLISFLSCGALGAFPTPTFCQEAPVYCNHLSLSGVVIADMLSSRVTPEMSIFSSLLPSRRPWNRIWFQIENRAYMFGAIRNEPDAFTDAFLRELKSRPDLFQVITRSETDPGQEIEVYGPSPEHPIPHVRTRKFEVPREVGRPEGQGEWISARSAKDILYDTNPNLLGYLPLLNQSTKSRWFFNFKKFKVKYIVIMDTP